MTRPDDDLDVMRRLDDRTADAVLSGHGAEAEPELAAFVQELRTVETSAPVPSPALAALLEAGLVGVAAPLAPRSTTWTRAVTWCKAHRPGLALPLQAGLAASACLALVLGGAATNALPDPVQTAVADVVEAVTPLDVPRPSHPAPPAPVVTPADDDADEADDVQRGTGSEQSDRRGRGGERSEGRDDSSDGRSGNADEGSTNRDDRSGNSDGRADGQGSGSQPDDHPAPTQRPTESGHHSGSGSSGGGSDDDHKSGGSGRD